MIDVHKEMKLAATEHFADHKVNEYLEDETAEVNTIPKNVELTVTFRAAGPSMGEYPLKEGTRKVMRSSPLILAVVDYEPLASQLVCGEPYVNRQHPLLF